MAENAVKVGNDDRLAKIEGRENKTKEFEERLSFLGIDDQVRQDIRGIQPVLDEHLSTILTGFYEHIGQWPNLNKLFKDQAHKDAAKNLQIAHWSEIAAGTFDRAYSESAHRIGQAHNRIGLDPRWYIGGYAALVCGVVSAMIKENFSSGFINKNKIAKFDKQLQAFLRASFLDMDVAISTYLDAGQEELSQILEQMTDNFDENVAGFIRDLAIATRELGKTATSLNQLSDAGQQKAQELKAASSSATDNVNSVATTSEEMAASIREINSQVTNASKISQEAVREADDAGVAVSELQGSSEKIGAVVSLIRDIAEQTNLLALNATIEAARAGEAGKGFAVVANEVKSLASQTGRATEEIAVQISSMQDATANTVKVIENVSKTINEINEIASAISTAMEEQSSAIQDVVKNTQSAAGKTSQVGGVVQDVSRSADETRQASNQISAAARDLSERTEKLRGVVEVFLSNLKAA